MPSRSKAQNRFFQMVAHDPAAAKRVGVPQSVGKDFVAADKGKDLSKFPERVKKAEGGKVSSAYPPPFRW